MISIRPSAKHESENLDLATSQAVDGEVAFVNRVQARTLRIGENEIVASSFHCKRCEGTRASHAAFLVTR